MKYYITKIIICTLLILTLAFSATAATWSEMQENGEVSDGGIRYGDPRDGIVSDVTNGSEGLIPEISSAIDDGLGIDGDQTMPDTSSDTDTNGMGDIKPETSRVTSEDTSNTSGTTGTADSNSGMSAGLVIAILVVVAVVVIILIMLMKKR
ncbi:MAG: hypothetical protein IKU61_04370 [Clostridia bacterium]|nr:hypothetical protein [Clostridia bacterium]